MFQKFFLISIFLISNLYSQDQYQEWNEGPYGSEFFDIAAPFTFYELNPSIPGDVNSDEILNSEEITNLYFSQAFSFTY